MTRTISLLLTSGILLVASESAVAQGSSGGDRRFRVFVNGSLNATTTSFTESSTFTVFLEESTSRRNYESGTGFVFELGGIVSLTPSLGIMGSFELFDGSNDGAFEEIVPHPLFFDQDRSATGDVPGLSYREQAVHLDAVFTRAFSSMTVDLFGGPTFFITETELIGGVTTVSTYPFDDLEVSGTERVTLDDNPIGFNVGGSLTYRFNAVVGVAFQARFSRATVSVQRNGADPVEFDAGGFRAGGGIRLAF